MRGVTKQIVSLPAAEGRHAAGGGPAAPRNHKFDYSIAAPDTGGGQENGIFCQFILPAAPCTRYTEEMVVI